MAAVPANLQANVGMCCNFSEMRNQINAAGNPFLGPFVGTNYRITGVTTGIGLAANDFRYLVVPNLGAGPGQEIIFPTSVTSLFACAAPAAAPVSSVAPAAGMSGGRKRKQKARKTRRGRKVSKRRRMHK